MISFTELFKDPKDHKRLRMGMEPGIFSLGLSIQRKLQDNPIPNHRRNLATVEQLKDQQVWAPLGRLDDGEVKDPQIRVLEEIITSYGTLTSSSSWSDDSVSTIVSGSSGQENCSNANKTIMAGLERARRLADRHQYLLERLEGDVMKGDINADAMEKRLEILDAVFNEAKTIYAGLDEESCPPPEMPKEAVITVSLRDIETRNTGDPVVSSSNSCVVEEEEALPYGFELRQIQKMKSLAYQKQWGMAVEQLLQTNCRHLTKTTRWAHDGIVKSGFGSMRREA